MYFSNDSLNTEQSASLVRFFMFSIFFYQQGKRYIYIYIILYLFYDSPFINFNNCIFVIKYFSFCDEYIWHLWYVKCLATFGVGHSSWKISYCETVWQNQCIYDIYLKRIENHVSKLSSTKQFTRSKYRCGRPNETTRLQNWSGNDR